MRDETLFTDNLPIASSYEELREIKKQYPNYDYLYVSIGCNEKLKEKFDNLWVKFKPFVDSHFLTQYKKKFHERTWEMYLGCVLLENNLKIKSLDRGPDFIVDDSEYIECTSVNKGDPGKPDSVPNMIISDIKDKLIFSDVPRDQMILRITSAIRDKLKQYNGWDHLDKNKPFIIALSTSELEHIQDYIGIPIVISALFGVHFLNISSKGEKRFSVRQTVKKNKTTEISVDIFNNNSYQNISGIIFSDKKVLDHPEKIGEDCVFVNNPFALTPVDFNKYSFLKTWYAENGELVKLYK